MKKKLLILFIALIPISGSFAKSIKVKIAELKQAYADHAQSEKDTWQWFEQFDKRLSDVENKYIGYTLDNQMTDYSEYEEDDEGDITASST